MELKGAVAVIEKDGKHFLIKQSKGKPLGGQWRHPGGKFEEGEKPSDGLKREIKEELGIEIEVVGNGPFFVTKADYLDCYFGFFKAVCTGGDLKADKSEIDDYGWFTLEEISKMDLMNATRVFYREIYKLNV